MESENRYRTDQKWLFSCQEYDTVRRLTHQTVKKLTMPFSHWLAIPYFLSSLLVVLYPIGILVLGALYRPPGRPSQWIVDSVMMFVLLAVGLGSTFILTSNMWYTFAISLTLLGCWFLVRSIIQEYD